MRERALQGLLMHPTLFPIKIRSHRMKLFVSRSLFLIVPLLVASCQTQPGNPSASQATATPSPVASPNSTPTDVSSTNTPVVTLPVLDAFFADSSFPETLKSRLQLSDEQVTKLKDLAHAATANLDEASAGATAGESADARSRAQEEITRVIGADKTRQLATLVQEQWNGTDTTSTAGTASTAPTTNPTTAQEFAALKPNTVPTDSRKSLMRPRSAWTHSRMDSSSSLTRSELAILNSPYPP